MGCIKYVTVLLLFFGLLGSTVRAQDPQEVLERSDRVSRDVEVIKSELAKARSQGDYAKSKDLVKELFRVNLEYAPVEKEIADLAPMNLDFFLTEMLSPHHHATTRFRLVTEVMAMAVRGMTAQQTAAVLNGLSGYLELPEPSVYNLGPTGLRLYALFYNYEIPLEVRERVFKSIEQFSAAELERIRLLKNSTAVEQQAEGSQRERSLASFHVSLSDIHQLLIGREWPIMEQSLKNLFNQVDRDGNQKTCFSELLGFARGTTPAEGKRLVNEYAWLIQKHLGMDPDTEMTTLKLWDLQVLGRKLLAAMDQSKDGWVAQSEFIEFLRDSLFTMKGAERVWLGFSEADLNSDGEVSVGELSKAVGNWAILPEPVRNEIMLRLRVQKQ